MHRLNYTLFFIAALGVSLSGIHERVSAQSMEVHLDEVQIRGSAKSAGTADLHTVRIDTVLKTKYFGSDLAQILKSETNLNITQYGGQGSLASLRLRGSAPSQTQINWNGIPLNSPTTGSTDLSLLAGGMADAIEIAYGAGGSLFGNGTFGGSVNLYNKPDWSNRFSANLAGEAGSWSHFKGGAGIRAGNDSMQYHLTGLYQMSPNTYRFKNTFKAGNPVEYRVNDSMNLMAFQQHLFFRLHNNWFLQVGTWLHGRVKQLPANMSSTPMFTAFQTDRSFRQYVRTSKWYRKSSLELVGAFFTDSMLYEEKVIQSDSILKHSGIRSSEAYMSLFHRWFISDYFTLENGAELEIQSARVDSYNRLASETRGAVFSHLKFSTKPFTANLSYRQVFYSMTGPKPLFSVSFEYDLPVSGIAIKGQVSNKFRYPTLNDRYWQPGGNPDLLPETGLGYDLGWVWKAQNTVRSGVSLSALAFMQNINNWIQWVPSGTYWSPQNVKKVQCRGLELDLTGRWKSGPVGITAKSMYTYSESLDMSLPGAESRYSRQLAYVPFHLLKLQAGIDFQRFQATLGYRYTGRRFTSDDHLPWLDLDPFHLADFSLRYNGSMKKDRMIITGTISNLFDTGYQSIRAYPAPGRSFYLSVNYLFNQKKSQK